VSPEAIERLPELIEPWFLFSLVWSVGASCENNGRVKFSEWLRTLIAKESIKMPFPKEGLVYDYMVDDGGLFNQDEDKEEEDQAKKAKIVIHKSIKNRSQSSNN
jgi:dynein heavy chain